MLQTEKQTTFHTMHDCAPVPAPVSLTTSRSVTAREMDCFYTKPLEAQRCLEFLYQTVDVSAHDMWVEPSAGAGVFLDLLPSPKIGMDINPSSPDVIRQDFLSWAPPHKRNIIAIGNPPFGKNSSLAVRFFNHAAQFSTRIAMIFPRTFRKESLVNRLHPHFHLESTCHITEHAFTFQGKSYDVPTIFQIWTRRDYAREKRTSPSSHADFSFTEKNRADFAIQRVGAGAGKVKIEMESLSPHSHYFLNSHIDGVRQIFQHIDWSSAKYDTAGNPSLAKPEIVRFYALCKKEHRHAS